MTVIGLTGMEYQLNSKAFSSGGEGEIYRIPNDTDKKIAKIYHPDAISPELEEKLKYMVENPPNSKVLSQVAWPLDVVYDTAGSFCGFIMPELNISAELGEIYKYPATINISSRQKITIAKNICAVIAAVHKAGYVFGDFNPRNIGVDIHTGKVAFLDTDTYHVTDSKTNKVYRCNVCAPGYSAPELLEKCADHVSKNPDDSKNQYAKTPLPTFTKETDNFALAIHIFKLLNNGYTPFGGIKETASPSQSSPGTGDAAVRRDNYCFKPGNKPQAAAIPPIEVFPQEIADLFTCAFMFGKLDPKQRPSALEWHVVLAKYEKDLVICSKSKLHQYDKKNKSCPWCEADRQYEKSIEAIPEQEEYSEPVQPSNNPYSGHSLKSSQSSASKKPFNYLWCLVPSITSFFIIFIVNIRGEELLFVSLIRSLWFASIFWGIGYAMSVYKINKKVQQLKTVKGKIFHNKNTYVVYWIIGIHIFIGILTSNFIRFPIFGNKQLYYYLGMSPVFVMKGWIWTFLTYFFVQGDLLMLIMDILVLFFFGTQIERHIGSREFIRFYFVIGTLAGVFLFFIYYLTGYYNVILIGAFSVVFAIQLAYFVFFPSVQIRIMILVLLAIEVSTTFFNFDSAVSYLPNLLGFIVAWLYFFIRFGINPWNRIISAKLQSSP